MAWRVTALGILALALGAVAAGTAALPAWGFDVVAPEDGSGGTNSGLPSMRAGPLLMAQGGPQGGPQGGRLVLFYVVPPDQATVFCLGSSDGGRTWQRFGELGKVAVVAARMDPAGNFAVVTADSKVPGKLAAALLWRHFARAADGGQWKLDKSADLAVPGLQKCLDFLLDRQGDPDLLVGAFQIDGKLELAGVAFKARQGQGSPPVPFTPQPETVDDVRSVRLVRMREGERDGEKALAVWSGPTKPKYGQVGLYAWQWDGRSWAAAGAAIEAGKLPFLKVGSVFDRFDVIATADGKAHVIYAAADGLRHTTFDGKAFESAEPGMVGPGVSLGVTLAVQGDRLWCLWVRQQKSELMLTDKSLRFPDDTRKGVTAFHSIEATRSELLCRVFDGKAWSQPADFTEDNLEVLSPSAPSEIPKGAPSFPVVWESRGRLVWAACPAEGLPKGRPWVKVASPLPERTLRLDPAKDRKLVLLNSGQAVLVYATDNPGELHAAGSTDMRSWKPLGRVADQAWDTFQADMAVGAKDAIHLAHASGRSVIYQALSVQDGKMKSGPPVEVAKTSSPPWPSIACFRDKIWIAYADGAKVCVRSSADDGRTWVDVRAAPAGQSAFTRGVYPCLVSTPAALRGLVCLVGSEAGVVAAVVPEKGEMAWQEVVALPGQPVNHNFTTAVDGAGAIHLFASPQANLARDGAVVHAIGVGGDGNMKWSRPEPVTTRPAEGLAATALGERILLAWSRTLDTEQGEICWRVWDCRAGKWVGDENSLTSDHIWYCHPKLPWLPPTAGQAVPPSGARLPMPVPLVWMHPGDLRAWTFQVDKDGLVGPRRVER